MKILHPNLKVVISIALPAVSVCSLLSAAPPAYSLWFFKHKENSNNQSANSQYSNNQIMQGSGRRLVPSHLGSNRTAAQKPIPIAPKVVKPKIVDAPVVAPAIAPILPNKLSSDIPLLDSIISNTVPTNQITTYTKTNIKIGIGFNLLSAKVAILDGAELIDNSNGQIIAKLPAQSEWILSIENNTLSLKPDKEFYIALQRLADSYGAKASTVPSSYTASQTIINTGKQINIQRVIEQNNADNNLSVSTGYTLRTIVNRQDEKGLLALNNRVYRGDFLIKPNASNFSVINSLDLEDYLLSVVPSEMPSLWPLEALKAQAIAARSYALANLGKHGSSGYDLKDNIEDQVYLGVKSENEYTNEAVNATRGLVLRYNGKPVCAYFHSSSGGSTERAEHVWHSPVPYLKAVIDFDQEAPLYNWTKNYSIAQTESGLPKDIGQILSITILAKSPSGRATYILINGSNNSRIITGEAARKYFSLPSTNFNVTPGETTYIFVGKGFGHGLGLSQWGARSLAKHGYNAAQILCYYYDGISIDF